MKSNLEPRSGPRIFVGKLNKETTENDVKVQRPAVFLRHAPDAHASCQSAVCRVVAEGLSMSGVAAS